MPAPHEPITKENAEIVDLFAGPGGMDAAARSLGKRVIGIELDADACLTRAAEGLATIQEDVRAHHPEEFPNATVLMGGPPCQTYSMAGKGEGRQALDQVVKFATHLADGNDITEDVKSLSDPRTALVLEPLRWALRACDNGRPFEAIVLEQVPAVLPIWEEIGKILQRKEEYSFVADVLHTEQYGVPQTRRRAILIARLNGKAELPEVTHRPYRKGTKRNDGDQDLKRWVSMGDALHWRRKFRVVSNYGSGGDPKNRGERENWEPAATVTSKILRNRIIFSDKTETRFTYRQAGILQTFDKNYQWRGKDIPKQIGNAVPPLLGRCVLEAALDLAHGASIPQQAGAHDAASTASSGTK